MTILQAACDFAAPRMRLSVLSIVLLMAAVKPAVTSAQGSIISESPSNYVLPDGTGSLLGSVIFKPVSSVLPTSVYAYRLTVSKGRQSFVQTCVTRVEKDGSYNCREVPVGQYVLVAAPSNRHFRNDQRSDIAIDSMASYYLPFPSFSDSNLVTVVKNQQVTVDFQISPRATYGISGQLQEGDTASDVALFLVSDSGHILRLPNLSLGGNAGGFGFDALPAGHYLIRGQRVANGRKQVAAKHVTLPRLTNEIEELRYPELHTVTVEMNGIKDNESVPKFSLTDLSSGGRYTVSERHSTNAITLSGVPSGKYRIELEGDKSRCIELDNLSRVGDGEDQIIDLLDGNKDLLLSGVYREQCVTMRGRLRDGKPGDVIIADGSFHCLARLRTDATGAFALPGLLPGDYTVFAWRTSKAVPFNDPQYLARLCAGACRITLTSDDSDTDSVQVDFQPELEP